MRAICSVLSPVYDINVVSILGGPYIELVKHRHPKPAKNATNATSFKFQRFFFGLLLLSKAWSDTTAFIEHCSIHADLHKGRFESSVTTYGTLDR